MDKVYINQSNGFTLIELLIVIGVLAVLAVSVLIALNPLEQLARGRDAGRTSSIVQLGHAMHNYISTIRDGTFPSAGASWQTPLTASKEINQVISLPSSSTFGDCANNVQGKVCYQDSSGTDAIIWTNAESKNLFTRAGCSGTQVPTVAWIGSQGRVGVFCLATATTLPSTPYSGIVLK